MNMTGDQQMCSLLSEHLIFAFGFCDFENICANLGLNHVQVVLAHSHLASAFDIMVHFASCSRDTTLRSPQLSHSDTEASV